MASDSPESRYEVLECIGRGSYGEVYKAIDRTTGEQVAVKVINLEDVEDDIEDIRKEISALAGCRSKNITEYYGSVLYPGTTELMIVMELLSCSVADLLKLGPLDEPTIAYILHEVLQALVYLHGEKRVHRDLKAANILLSSAGEVKIADFGVSGQLTDTMGYKRKTFVGTPFWMAPEVIQSSEAGYSERADIWSLGITAIEMAHGQPPHHEQHPMRVLFLIPKSDPPTLEGRFSQQLVSFVASCLQKDPARRPSAQDLLTHPLFATARQPPYLPDMLLEYARHRQPIPARGPPSIGGATLPAWDFGTKRMTSAAPTGVSPPVSEHASPSPPPTSTGTLPGRTLSSQPSWNRMDSRSGTLPTGADWRSAASGAVPGGGPASAMDLPLKAATLRQGTLKADPSGSLATSNPRTALNAGLSSNAGGGRPLVGPSSAAGGGGSPLRGMHPKVNLQVDVDEGSSRGGEISGVVRADPAESSALLTRVVLPALRSQPLQDAATGDAVQAVQAALLALEQAVPGSCSRLMTEVVVKLSSSDQPVFRPLKSSLQAIYGRDTPQMQRAIPDLGPLGEFLLGQWRQDVAREKARFGRAAAAAAL